MEWYPQQSKELNALLEKLLKHNPQKQEVHGIIVPHAGYPYSGATAGKAFSYLKNSNSKKAIILAPSHYVELRGLAKHNKDYWETPLGKIKTFDEKIGAEKMDLKKEHAIGNQIPFLQKLKFQEILPLMVGSITMQEAEKIAKELSEYLTSSKLGRNEAEKIAKVLSNKNCVLVISADLSHFSEYSKAVEKDKKTIEVIQNLDFDKLEQIDSCGLFPIIITMNLCKINNWNPKLIEYKNSGDITKDKTSVVGYASFVF
ncbi:MAG: AmmeMemoRadiSam system protein B [archaeon]